MSSLPSGTVTFVFSDIEGSTALLKRLRDAAYAELLATHRRLMREIFAAHHGQEIDTQGDAFFYSFARAREAVRAAVEVQRAHADGAWPQDASVRLRLGLHTGEPAIGEEGYTGLDVVRASRIAAIGRGGQVLLSDTTRAIVADDLPDGVELRSLGERQLRDIDRPEPLTELIIPGVEITAEPGLTDADRVPVPVPQLPTWMRTASRFVPGNDQTRELIEGRVLSALTDAFEERDARIAERFAQPNAPKKTRPDTSKSLAEEVERLRSLRDDGALTEEQYTRAVDQAIAKGR
ncbi:MAG: adenylate/guanylate cyclase domain-containing protein [Candidatus Limnocylindria bacterium]